MMNRIMAMVDMEVSDGKETQNRSGISEKDLFQCWMIKRRQK